MQIYVNNLGAVGERGGQLGCHLHSFLVRCCTHTEPVFLNVYGAPESIPMNSASLCSLAGRYDNPLPPRFLAPIDSLKIPAQKCSVGPQIHKVHTYTEYHSVSPLVGGHTCLRVRGWGSPNYWRKSLALCLLCAQIATTQKRQNLWRTKQGGDIWIPLRPYTSTSTEHLKTVYSILQPIYVPYNFSYNFILYRVNILVSIPKARPK